MIYITGDTHRDFSRIYAFCEKVHTTEDDIMIILGDAGINFELNQNDVYLKKKLSKLPITLFCVQGNHEERPFNIKSYKTIDFCEAKAYAEKAYPNLIFAKDGEIYNFEGKTFLVIGGAYSVDKDYRLLHGYRWFPDEQPNDEIKNYVESQIEAFDFAVDCVLSHTTPESCEPTWAFMEGIDQSKVDKSTEKWLDKIHKVLCFNNWFAGHFHVNSIENDIHILYENVIKFDTVDNSVEIVKF